MEYYQKATLTTARLEQIFLDQIFNVQITPLFSSVMLTVSNSKNTKKFSAWVGKANNDRLISFRNSVCAQVSEYRI